MTWEGRFNFHSIMRFVMMGMISKNGTKGYKTYSCFVIMRWELQFALSKPLSKIRCIIDQTLG